MIRRNAPIAEKHHLWTQLVRNYRVMVKVAQHPLHRHSRMRAVVSWTRKLASITLAPSHEITVDYVDGAVLHWPAAASSVRLCARFGLGEYSDMAFCRHLLREGDLFCDIGANAGVYTVLAAHAVGCKVVCAEPIPTTYELLMQNLYANGISHRVDACCSGIGGKAGHLSFTTKRQSFNHVVEPGTEGATDVDVITLDMLLAARVPTAIKIDVEGFEGQVLAGAANTLRSPMLQAVLIEMTDQVTRYGGSLDAIRTLLRSSGLEGPHWYAPEQRKLVPPGTPGPTKYNEIYVRDLVFAASRLANAPTHSIHGANI